MCYVHAFILRCKAFITFYEILVENLRNVILSIRLLQLQQTFVQQ